MSHARRRRRLLLTKKSHQTGFPSEGWRAFFGGHTSFAAVSPFSSPFFGAFPASLAITHAALASHTFPASPPPPAAHSLDPSVALPAPLDVSLARRDLRLHALTARVGFKNLPRCIPISREARVIIARNENGSFPPRVRSI